jgi:hypothetical protein
MCELNVVSDARRFSYMLLRLCESLEQVPWIATINSTAWMISIVWLIHYLGVFLMVGTIAFLDLRILGLAGKGHSVAQLAGGLFPWTWTGLGMVVLSGLLMFAGQATTFYSAPFFRIKIAWLVLALICLIVQRKIPRWDQLKDLPRGAKWLAMASLVLWIGAILASLEVPAFTPGI